MQMRDSRILGVGILAALVLAAVLLIVLVGADGSSEPTEEAVQEVTTRGPLLVSTRNQLSLCVDGGSGLVVGVADLERVRDALANVLRAAEEVPVEYRDWAVSLGCPPPVALTGELFARLDERYSLVSSRGLSSPAEASPHRLHVYFLPPDTYATSFGDRWVYVTTGEEITCRVHVCSLVTQGLYITPSTGNDVLFRAIRAALVLQPLVPDLAEYTEFCLSGTLEEWCGLYNYCQVVPAAPSCKDYGVEPTARPETPIATPLEDSP